MKRSIIILTLLIFYSVDIWSENNLNKVQIALFKAVEKNNPKMIRKVLEEDANILSENVLYKKSALESVLSKLENQEKIKSLKYIAGLATSATLIAFITVTGLALFDPKHPIPGYKNALHFGSVYIPICGILTILCAYITNNLVKDPEKTYEILLILLNKLKKDDKEDIPNILIEYYKNHKIPKEAKNAILNLIEEKKLNEKVN